MQFILVFSLVLSADQRPGGGRTVDSKQRRTNPDLSPALNTEISLSEIDLEQSKHSGFIEKLQK